MKTQAGCDPTQAARMAEGEVRRHDGQMSIEFVDHHGEIRIEFCTIPCLTWAVAHLAIVDGPSRARRVILPCLFGANGHGCILWNGYKP